ncbi:hypothetical protein ACFY36_10880 [Actinoplanes sp. NPDC000266]
MTSTNPTPPSPSVPRAVWIGFALIAGVLVGAATGLLSYAGGVPMPLAVVAGGGACGATIALVLTLVRYATDGS